MKEKSQNITGREQSTTFGHVPRYPDIPSPLPDPLSELQVDRRCECVPIKPLSRSTSLPSLSSSHWHFSPPLELASFISATLSLAVSFSTTHTTGTNGHSYCSGGRSIEDARGSRYVGWTGLATVF